jgi:lipopolysaccharide transport protein LptA
MQKTVRILRVILPVLFVAFLVLIALSYTATVRRSAGGVGQTERSVRKGDRPALVSYTFEDTQTVGGRVVSRIRARRTTGFESGWYALEETHLTIYRKEGGTYELMAPLAQFHSQTKEAEISGGVRLTSSDGIEIVTREVKFDGNRILNRIPVQFRVNQWRGEAGAVDLDVSNDRLRLFDVVTAHMTPANPAEVPMTVRAEEGTFIRKFGEVKFERNVVITRGSDRLSSDWIQAMLDDRNEVLVELKGEGNLVVDVAASSTMSAGASNTGGAKRIEADRFFCELGPRGEIRAVNALGEQGPARAFLAGPPARRFTAPWMRMAVEGPVLRELKADKGVVLEEASAKGPRILRAGQMYVYFDPVTRQATSSLIQNSLEYRDSEVTASAERANYDITADRMILTPVSGSLVTIVAQQNTIRASMVELSPRDQSMRAKGHVAATLTNRSGGGAAAGETSIFPAGAPVYVNSDTAVFRQATGIALFQGNVRAWQELNTLLTSELSVQGAGEVLHGRGAVKMVLYNSRGKESQQQAASRQPVVATSDGLTYRKNERRIELAGNVRIEEMTRLLTTDKANLEFSAAQKLERVDAEGKVHLTDSSVGRKGNGEKAIYRLNEQVLLLHGKPAELTDPRGVLRGEQITYDIPSNKAVISSGSAASESTYRPE